MNILKLIFFKTLWSNNTYIYIKNNRLIQTDDILEPVKNHTLFNCFLIRFLIEKNKINKRKNIYYRLNKNNKILFCVGILMLFLTAHNIFGWFLILFIY